MRLHERGVGLGEVGGALAGADGLHEGVQSEVSGVAQDTVAGSGDKAQGGLGDGGVRESALVKLIEDEGGDGVGIELAHENRVAEAASQVLVDGEGECGEQFGLGEEDEVVVGRELGPEEPESAQVLRMHEVGVVDDQRESLPVFVPAEGFFDEPFLLAGPPGGHPVRLTPSGLAPSTRYRATSHLWSTPE